MPCPTNVLWNLTSSNSCSDTPWYIVQNNQKIFYYVKNSIQCGGDCCDVQSGVATASISVGSSDVWFDLNYENITQLQLSGKNKLTVSLNNATIFISESVSSNLGCLNGPGNYTEYTKLPIRLAANTANQLKIEYSTVTQEYQNNCYAMIEILFDCVEPSQSPTPTPTVTPPDCDCRNSWCRDEGCITPTQTPTTTQTPPPSPTPTHTTTETKTPTPTASPCSNCYYYDLTIAPSDLSVTGIIYVRYIPCGGTTFVTTQFNQSGVYENAFCAQDCITPQICTSLNPCVAPSLNTYATKQGLCSFNLVSCPTTFNYDVNESGQILLNASVEIGQNYGNLDVTVSSNNFNEITEIFVGNLDNKIGEIFTFKSGQNSLTKKLGFYSPNVDKTTLDLAIYSQGTDEFPFQSNKISFYVSCPYLDGCETTPTSTPCPTVTPTPSSPAIIKETCVLSSDWGAWRLIRIGSPQLSFIGGRIDNGLNLLFLPQEFKFPFYTFGKGIRLQVIPCSQKGGLSPNWINVFSMTSIWGNSIIFPSNKLVIKNVNGVPSYNMLITPYKNF